MAIFAPYAAGVLPHRHEVTMQVVEAKDINVKHGIPHCYIKVDVLHGDNPKPLFHVKTQVCY